MPMSAIQREEMASGTALEPCRMNVILYGLRSGWRSDKEKFDPSRIPICLPEQARQEILSEYAIYSACYDLGEGAHGAAASPIVQKILGLLGAIIVAYLTVQLAAVALPG